jgi:hypothetical protein
LEAEIDNETRVLVRLKEQYRVLTANITAEGGAMQHQHQQPQQRHRRPASSGAGWMSALGSVVEAAKWAVVQGVQSHNELVGYLLDTTGLDDEDESESESEVEVGEEGGRPTKEGS